ncbi:MAG: right-handed parallel beta-helix repeat-containing protein [Thermoplasmatales archaeon]|nr:MAG: right-handed parallel beta-helix repeat-containing protein [Thermoplasmatales archaeon]
MKNNTMNKWTTITITLIIIFTALSPSITASEPHSVYGYLYINDKLAPSGVMIRLRFPDICVIGVTDYSGYYQIDFSGFDGETGNFIISYSEELYIPIDNQSVYIDPNITNYNIDLHIKVIPSIVYVDDDFNITTPGWQIDFFDKIQDGINAVNQSGSVFVYNGSYYENIVINKTINLIGEDNKNTIIDAAGNGDVIFISSDKVNISGFKIKNANDSDNAGISISSNNNIIMNNNIVNNSCGIYLQYSSHNYIWKNNIENNFIGIATWFSCCDYNIFIENELLNNTGGICLTESKNCQIIDNIIRGDNSTPMSGGIMIQEFSINNEIIGNSISNYEFGIFLCSSINTVIKGNNIFSNSRFGLFLQHCSVNNNITRNNFINNGYEKTFKIRGNAFFIDSEFTPYFNKWNENYWDNWIGLKFKLFSFFPCRIPGRWGIIQGIGILFPTSDFDRHPAKEPYDI